MKKRILVLGMLLALVAVMALPMAALAVDTVVVTGTVPAATYTLTPPEAFAIASMPPITGGASANQTVSAATNNNNKTYASVMVSGSNNGTLTLSSTSLSSHLALAGTGFTAVSALTGVDQPLVTQEQGALSEVGAEKTWSITTLVVTQPPYLWVTAGEYTCTITFTATFG